MEQALVVPSLYRESRTKGSENLGDLALSDEWQICSAMPTFYEQVTEVNLCCLVFSPDDEVEDGSAVSSTGT
jgi:hypothetical protein